MKLSKLLFLFIISLGVISPLASAQEKLKVGKKYLTLYLGVGQQEILSTLPPGAEFYGDYNNVLKAEIDRERKTLRFTPTKPGVASMTINDRKGRRLFEYRFDVRSSELTKTVREVRGLLTEIEGISVKIVNDKVVIDGEVLLDKDLNRIAGVIEQYGGKVASLVTVSPIAQKKIALIIEREINNPDIEVRAVNGKFILKGIANSLDERELAEIITKTYIPSPVIQAAEKSGQVKKRKEAVVINLIAVRAPAAPAPKKIIQLVVHYVELNKTYLRSSEFGWRPSLQDDTTELSFTQDSSSNNSGIITQISGVINNLLPKLNYAKQHSFARILKSASVTTTSGKKANISTNTPIPYEGVRQGASLGGNQTQFQNVQFQAKITPTVQSQRSDMVSMSIDLRADAFLGSNASGPLVKTNQISTTVGVRSGQSAAIGGIVENDSATQYNPDANSNAIVNFYAGKKFNRNKNQYVMFVTPIIKTSASAGSEKVKSKFRLRE